jgi:uncharacterized membrane protein YkoI
MKREECTMNIKVVIFSTIAVLGTVCLLWAGYHGIESKQQDHEDDEEAEELMEQQAMREHDAVRAITQRGDILSLDQILRNVRRQHPGRILETELEQKHGRYVYEVELVDDQGRVRELRFDASTGEVLKEELED